MPELPEVEVVRSGLEPAVTGAHVVDVEVLDARSLKRHDARRGDFVGMLRGAELGSAVRRGKFLWFPLRGDEALVAHLGMSGQMLLREPAAPSERSTRLQIHLEHPRHGALRLDFVDQRVFGSLAMAGLVPTSDGGPGGFAGASPAAAVLPTSVAHIARDPLDPWFSDAAFRASLARSRSGVKRVLLDQTRISGIGNIYADEALWAARIHGDRPADSLRAVDARRLLAEARGVLRRALAQGGTSFDSQYVNVNGESGYFSRSLAVYGREGEPCSRCGSTIIRMKFMNRSSHLCLVCQRKR